MSSKKLFLPSDKLWTGVNCDSEESKALENFATGIPKQSCDLRQAGSGMFPLSFNQLRATLYNEHADIWEIVSGMMIYNHEYFILSMNEILDTRVSPNMGMDASCQVWLTALENRPKTYRS